MTPPLEEPCCGNCDAFVSAPNARAVPSQGIAGTCRAKPPKAIPVMRVNPVTQIPEMAGLQSGWPPTTSTEWCRQWNPDKPVSKFS
jgi:hypothetical protein